MSRVTKLASLFSALATVPSVFASEAAGVSSSAEALFRPVSWFPITNSMVTSWIVAAILIIAIRLAIKRPQLIPSRGQAIVENLVEGIYDLIAPIVGAKVARPAFPLLVGL